MADKPIGYAKLKNGAGEDYYCPAYVTERRHDLKTADWDDCVEASTVGRYAGNLDIVDAGAA
jgi:hypothetical protein